MYYINASPKNELLTGSSYELKEGDVAFFSFTGEDLTRTSGSDAQRSGTADRINFDSSGLVEVNLYAAPDPASVDNKTSA